VKPEHQDLVNKAQAIDPAPVAIEAMWDGDTRGWFVELLAVVPEGKSFVLCQLRIFDGGSDIRLLNGQVPTWPEAKAAAAAGSAVAGVLGVPFFFPSPHHPEDTCPHWWERKLASPCERCAIPLVQDDNCRWRGLCYQCHLEVEREKREANWTPEERAAPRCDICGSPAVGQTGASSRCATCRDSYEDWVCQVCGAQLMTHKDYRSGDICDMCVMRERLARLTGAHRGAIQKAYAVDRFEAVLVLGKLIGCGLIDADRALDQLLMEETDLP